MQPNGLAQGQETEHCVSLRGLLNAGHLITVEASGPGYFPNAPLASCLAHCCADLFGRHRLPNDYQSVLVTELAISIVLTQVLNGHRPRLIRLDKLMGGGGERAITHVSNSQHPVWGIAQHFDYYDAFTAVHREEVLGDGADGEGVGAVHGAGGLGLVVHGVGVVSGVLLFVDGPNIMA